MRGLAGATAALAFAAPAQAAPFGELPFERTPGVATCLRATGEPGGVTQLGPLTTTSATDLFRLTADGAVRTARVRLGVLADCPAVAEAGGAGAVAGVVSSGRVRFEVRAAVRDPGGSFGAPQRLGAAAPPEFHGAADAAAAAVSPAGDAVVAWAQQRRGRMRIVAARRAPGGPFGPVEALTPWRRAEIDPGATAVRAAVSATGAATVAWTRSTAESGEADLATTSAAAGSPFPAASRLARVQSEGGVELAVAPDGWAVLAVAGFDRTSVFERPPGAGRFNAVADDDPLPPGELAVAVRDGGGAVVASWSGLYGSVHAAARPGPGGFSPWQRLAGSAHFPFLAESELYVQLNPGGPFPPLDAGNLRARVALGPDGGATVAWVEKGGGGGPTRPAVASGSLDDGFGERQRLGAVMRDVNGVAPVRLPDGRGAVAWTDNEVADAVFAVPRGGGRRHLAIEGAAPARSPAPPALRVTARPAQRLYADERLEVTARCSAACDLRAVARREGRAVAVGDATLRRAGRTPIRLSAIADRPWRDRGVVVEVRATAPGAARARNRSLLVRVSQRAAPPLAVPVGARAVCRGRRTVVTWRTERPARRMAFIAEGMPTRTRRFRDSTSGGIETVTGRGRRRFRLVLRPERPSAVRWVQLSAWARDRPFRSRSVLVRVAR